MASRNTSTDNPIADKAAAFGQDLADRASEVKDSMSDMARTATRRSTRADQWPRTDSKVPRPRSMNERPTSQVGNE